MIGMKPLIEEERRKFPWFYQFKVSKEAKDRIKRKKEAKKTEN